MGTKHRDILGAALHRFGVWDDDDPAVTYGTAEAGVHPGLAWIKHAAAAPDTVTDILIRNAANTGWLSLLALLFNAPTGLNAQAASYVLVLTDAGLYVTITNAAAVTLTVPTNAAVAFPIGTTIVFEQGGAGQITLTPSGGVTINSEGGKLKSKAQYAVGSIVKKAADVWTAFGNLSA